MLDTNVADSLGNQIKNWKKTYGENSKLNEFITWFEWK
tara:strand:+ start:1203 stop:1316 length:114 start_codon:yes stop_codon:yes gene_type:complete